MMLEKNKIIESGLAEEIIDRNLRATAHIDPDLAEEIIDNNLTATNNVRFVQEQIYGAFGRGDIPGLLGAVAEDVDWQFYGPSEVPFAGRYQGREDLMRLFGMVADRADIKTFEPREFIAQGDKVVVLGYEEVGVKGNGRTFQTNWVHVFTVRDGQVVAVREFYDTAAIAAAYA